VRPEGAKYTWVTSVTLCLTVRKQTPAAGISCMTHKVGEWGGGRGGGCYLELCGLEEDYVVGTELPKGIDSKDGYFLTCLMIQ
jgi:hypothetical protein